MAGSAYEKTLAAELIVVMGAQTADALSGAYTGSFTLPDPSRYVAAVVVFAALSAVAMFGEKPAKLSAAFGGVAATAILLAPSKRTNKPVILSVLDYLNQITTGGVQGAPHATTSSVAPEAATPTTPAAGS